jgi:4-amino-4-deoxy-L-arabinose transferase-like glycosyltransferase
MAEQIVTSVPRRPASLSRWMALLLAGFLALCVVYNVTLPIFEAPDEGDHFHYADFLARERHLPDLVQDLGQSHEIIQPPLYYILIAGVIEPFDRSNLDALSQLNPDWFDTSVNADHRSVANQYTHSSAEDFPYQGAALAIHVARFVSSLLGALTVWLVFLIARDLLRIARREDAWRAWPLLTAALVALNPKFIHVSSIVSNDIAITFASTLVCWWAVRLWILDFRFWIDGRRSVDDSESQAYPQSGSANVQSSSAKSAIGNPKSKIFSSFLLLGVLVGVAMLCKVTGLGLLVPVAALLVLLVLQRRLSLGQALLGTVAVGIGLLVVAGPWLINNQLHYGDPLAWAQVQAANQSLARTQPLTLWQIVQAIPEMVVSYWGLIGVELRFPVWLDIVFTVGLGIALIGCGVLVARWVASARRIGWGVAFAIVAAPVLVLLAWEAALLGSYVLWLRAYIGTENSRLIFPGIALVACAVAAGWMTLTHLRLRRVLTLAVCVALASVSALTPFLLITPAFATPVYLTPPEQAALPGQTGITFGGKIRLQHAQINQRSAQPGEAVSVSLYWGTLSPLNQSYHVILAARDAQGQLIGRLEAIPYLGRFDTQRWTPGKIFRDDYQLPIDATARRGIASIELSVREVYEAPPLLPVDGAGVNQFLIGSLKVLGALQAAPAARYPFAATFGSDAGNLIQLQGYDLQTEGDVRTLALHWLCLKQLNRDYTLFIHVLDSNGTIISQQDGQALNGAYPTSMWDEKEQIVDRRSIELPASATSLRIGWYVPGGDRLKAFKADGSAWPDGAVIIPMQNTDVH